MVTYYNEKDVISFGNFLLSDERKQNKINSRDEMIRQGGDPLSIEEMLEQVSHADVENWKFNEGLRKSKNFLKTLGVDMSKVRFCTASSFFFNDETGQMTHDPVGDGDFRQIQVEFWRNITTADIKEHCDSNDWAIFYITDDSRLITNEMGMVPSIMCAFFNKTPIGYKEDFEKSINPERFIVIPRELYNENMENINNLNLEKFRQDINDLIDETCEDNGWTRVDKQFQMSLTDNGLTSKASFKIQ